MEMGFSIFTCMENVFRKFVGTEIAALNITEKSEVTINDSK